MGPIGSVYFIRPYTMKTLVEAVQAEKIYLTKIVLKGTKITVEKRADLRSFRNINHCNKHQSMQSALRWNGLKC